MTSYPALISYLHGVVVAHSNLRGEVLITVIAISIVKELKEKAPALMLGCISAQVRVEERNDALWGEIETRAAILATHITLEQMSELPQIAQQRHAYKAVGKDPRRYRGSAEALLRRIIQGKGLYQVNTLVDINNLISLETRHPVGCYDRSKLQAPIVFRIGKAKETYQGIGKGDINIENLPVFADRLGAFGSPTSDSQRAPITKNTKNILMIVIAFGGCSEMENLLERSIRLLQQYAAADAIETKIIE